ncbi:PREDICTED: Reverse mRNAase RNA-dependent DNA polymerase, partial [Prunus dulcis]
IKKNADGTISRYKARLVAQGFSQEYGLDYEETFSPVVRHTTVRLILGLAVNFQWELRQLDVKNAFLHGSDPSLVTSVIQALSEVFELKDLGKLKYFLGLEVQYHSGGKIFVNQAKYARDLIKKASMDTCKPCSTPSKPHHQVLKDEGTPLPNPTLFRSIVGALQYLTFTRPDIAFAVNTVCQFMHSPTDVHLSLVKRIIRYLQGTLQFGVTFSPGSMVLSGYCDADWAGDPNTRRSTIGYVVFLGSNPISWSSNKQASVS